jgi:hypothetical protein
MTGLQQLELGNMQLPNRDAMAVCSSGLSHLQRLNVLALQGNQLSARVCTVLAITARSLPGLRRVLVLRIDEEPSLPSEREALLQRLDWLAGRDIFG